MNNSTEEQLGFKNKEKEITTSDKPVITWKHIKRAKLKQIERKSLKQCEEIGEKKERIWNELAKTKRIEWSCEQIEYMKA